MVETDLVVHDRDDDLTSLLGFPIIFFTCFFNTDRLGFMVEVYNFKRSNPVGSPSITMAGCKENAQQYSKLGFIHIYEDDEVNEPL